jgi:hypothetical protein
VQMPQKSALRGMLALRMTVLVVLTFLYACGGAFEAACDRIQDCGLGVSGDIDLALLEYDQCVVRLEEDLAGLTPSQQESCESRIES